MFEHIWYHCWVSNHNKSIIALQIYQTQTRLISRLSLLSGLRQSALYNTLVPVLSVSVLKRFDCIVTSLSRPTAIWDPPVSWTQLTRIHHYLAPRLFQMPRYLENPPLSWTPATSNPPLSWSRLSHIPHLFTPWLSRMPTIWRPGYLGSPTILCPGYFESPANLNLHYPEPKPVFFGWCCSAIYYWLSQPHAISFP